MNQKESEWNGRNIFEHIKKLKKAAPSQSAGKGGQQWGGRGME
jgi:hypothetical protein